jgi:hypothetical protein
MKNVWRELLRRNRKSGRFIYPVLLRGKDSRSEDDLQLAALGELLGAVFTAARDNMKTSKLEEIYQNKKQLLKNAELLRTLANDLELAPS